jgi:hypothetical protein
MKIKSAIIVVTTFLGVFASIALLGGVLQKAQDAGVSASDAGFVPSTGQINLGYTSKVPSNSLAREIPSGPDARAASEAEVIAPIGASPPLYRRSSPTPTIRSTGFRSWLGRWG